MEAGRKGKLKEEIKKTQGCLEKRVWDGKWEGTGIKGGSEPKLRKETVSGGVHEKIVNMMRDHKAVM